MSFVSIAVLCSPFLRWTLFRSLKNRLYNIGYVRNQFSSQQRPFLTLFWGVFWWFNKHPCTIYHSLLPSHEFFLSNSVITQKMQWVLNEKRTGAHWMAEMMGHIHSATQNQLLIALFSCWGAQVLSSPPPILVQIPSPVQNELNNGFGEIQG